MPPLAAWSGTPRAPQRRDRELALSLWRSRSQIRAGDGRCRWSCGRWRRAGAEVGWSPVPPSDGTPITGISNRVRRSKAARWMMMAWHVPLAG